jgi:uncharacterized protein (DUF1015 family)
MVGGVESGRRTAGDAAGSVSSEVGVLVDAAPFRALRYDPAVAGDPDSTSAPAYDELERFVFARHRTASPYTVLELVAPGASGDYAAAGATLRRWLRTGVLRLDDVAAFYRYEEHELRHGIPAVQRGVLAAVRLEEFPGSGSIYPHEGVDPARVAVRLERLEAVPVDLSPVFALSSDVPSELRGLLRESPPGPPVAALTDDAGVDHRVWALSAPRTVEVIRTALTTVRVVLADGHHRYATALALRERRRQRPPPGETAGAAVEAPWERTLMYVVDAAGDGPQVLPVHRLVGRLRPSARDLLAEDFAIVPASGDVGELQAALEAEPGLAFGLRLPGGIGLLLRARAPQALRARLPAGRSPCWRMLDAAVLDYAVLPAVCGTDPAAVRYRSGGGEAAREVDSGQAAALFLLRPVDTATVFALACAGETMPPKTTWFRPKPRAGLVMRLVDAAAFPGGAGGSDSPPFPGGAGGSDSPPSPGGAGGSDSPPSPGGAGGSGLPRFPGVGGRATRLVRMREQGRERGLVLPPTHRTQSRVSGGGR